MPMKINTIKIHCNSTQSRFGSEHMKHTRELSYQQMETFR